MQKVNVWKEKIILPTYEVGKPEKNPVFIEKRVYQEVTDLYILILLLKK